MANTQNTQNAEATVDPHTLANQSLVSAIRDIPENDPNKGVRIMESFEGYFKQIGRMDLADNVNKVLKLNQEGKYDLRKNFASSAQDIWKLARTSEQDLEKTDYSSFLKMYYDMQDKKLSTELDIEGSVLKGAAGGYKLIAMIGSIVSAIPGLEETGQGMVKFAIDQSKQLKLSDIENKTVRQAQRNGAHKPSISDASPADMAKEIADITERVLSDSQIAEEARKSRNATGGINPDAANTFQSNGQLATQPSPKPSVKQGKSPLCATPFGSKLEICREPG